MFWRDRINLITGNRYFFGASDREVAAKALNSEIGGFDPTVQNRFNNYENPYGFKDISGNINDVFKNYEDKINTTSNQMTTQQQQGAASSMASRGITGGSVLGDTQSKIASDVNRSKTDALSNLGANKSSAMASLMEYLNNMKMNQTKAATDVDMGNVGNKFQKYGLRNQTIGGLNDDTGFDDFTSIFGDLVKMAASDIRLKENLVKVDNKNGINVYEFNYIGNDKRFRGVIADEIEDVIPEAVKYIGGIKLVDYSKVGIRFEEV